MVLDGVQPLNSVNSSNSREERPPIFGLRDIPNIEQYFRPGTHWSSRGGPTYDIKHPPFDTTLWRYMDFAKFVSLLEKQSLFFTRADKLGDPFEGAWSDINLKVLELEEKAARDGNLPAATLAWRLVVRSTKQERRFTLVNCWHAGDHESEAMWRLYSGLGYGLAIKTDFKSLVHSFTDRVPDIIANVEYLSYENEMMPWSLQAPFLHKRLSFAHEQEVRAIIRCHNYKETDRPDVREIDYSEDVCDVGLPFAVDPADLIHEVVVSPYAQSWMLDLIRAVSERYGVRKPVSPSAMVRIPVWE